MSNNKTPSLFWRECLCDKCEECIATDSKKSGGVWLCTSYKEPERKFKGEPRIQEELLRELCEYALTLEKPEIRGFSPKEIYENYWLNLLVQLNARGKYVWAALWHNGMIIGVQKLCSCEDVKGFIKTYGGFAVGTNIGVIGTYTEKGIERAVEKADLNGSKHQY